MTGGNRILVGGRGGGSLLAPLKWGLPRKWKGVGGLFDGVRRVECVAPMKVPELEEQQGRNIYLSRSEYLSTTMLP